MVCRKSSFFFIGVFFLNILTSASALRNTDGWQNEPDSIKIGEGAKFDLGSSNPKKQEKHARSYNRDLKIPYPEKRIHSNKKKDQRSLGMTYPYGDYDPTKTIIRNDEPWFDDRGEELKANRCGKISRKKINGYWYMVGSQSNKEWDYGGDIWLYKSLTLGTNSWQRVKLVDDHDEGAGTQTSSSCAIYQKQIDSDTVFIFCRKKVFVSDSGPEGDYTQLAHLDVPFSHSGHGRMKNGASSMFEENGELFYITTRLQTEDPTNDRFAYIYKLNSDWTALSSEGNPIIATWPSNSREAPFIAKQDDWYYVFMSETRGWDQSITHYRRAKSMVELPSAREEEVVMHPANTAGVKSMGSQFCFFQEFDDGKWMFGGRRHPAEAPEVFAWDFGKHVMTPATFVDGVPHVYWKHKFNWTQYDYDSPEYDAHDYFYIPPTCDDASGNFFVEALGATKSCKWAKRNAQNRCHKHPEIPVKCPEGCGAFGC